MPKCGSASSPALTWAATTVVGTVALIQSFDWNDGEAMTSPFSATLAEDCRAQPSFRDNFESEDLDGPCAKPAATARTGTAHARSRRIFMKNPRGKNKCSRPILPELRPTF